MTSPDASPNVSPAQIVIGSLQREGSRALQPNYIPTNSKVDGWKDLRNKDPLSIRKNHIKRIACVNINHILRHREGEALFKLCAASMPWSRLGLIKDEDMSTILTWWDGHIIEFPNLQGSFDTHREPLDFLGRAEDPHTLEDRAQKKRSRSGEIIQQQQRLIQDELVQQSSSVAENQPGDPGTSDIDAQLEAPIAATLLGELLAHYPHWNSACGENFRKIKLTPLREASNDLALSQLWCNKLPELDTETCGDHVEIGAMLIEKIVESKKLTVVRGQRYVESKKKRHLAATALSQMNVQELFDESTICRIINVLLPDIEALQPKGDGYAHVLEPDEGLLFNVTPKGTFTDLHVDSGNDGRAIVFGDCVKIWLCWPPTDHNMKLWAANLGSPNQLASYGYQLEGGILVQTCNGTPSDGNTITLHGGPLHAVFTVRGGFLGGINYSTQYSLASMAKMIALQILREGDEGITDDMNWYKSTLHETIKKAHPLTLHAALASLVPLIKVHENYPLLRETARFAAVIEVIDSQLQELAKKKNKNGEWRCDCNKDLELTTTGVVEHFQ